MDNNPNNMGQDPFQFNYTDHTPMNNNGYMTQSAQQTSTIFNELYQETLPSGNNPYDLDKLPKFNWGACIFTWFWAIFNINPAWGIISLIAITVLSLVLSLLITPIGSFLVSIGAMVFFGLKGNELSWKYRKYESIRLLVEIQKKWTIAGIIYICVSLLFFIAFVTIGGVLFASLLSDVF